MLGLTFSFLTLQVYSIVTASLQYVCHPGNYLHTPRVGPDVCLPCQYGSFIPESLHRNRQCYNCTQVLDPSLEVVVSACNRTHDLVILCTDGYYRRVARNVRERDTCVPCSVCDHVTRPCQGYHDAVCCMPSYEAFWNKNGFYECKERPIVCGAGEFLSLKTEECTPCPPGSFMTSDKHNNTNCQLCQTLDDVAPHQDIVQLCNRTHPTQFACWDDFYRNTYIELKEENTNCLPCQTCEFKGGVCHKSASWSLERRCLFIDKTTETTTTQNSSGESASSPSPVCAERECLSLHPDTNTSSCLPCPDERLLYNINKTGLLSKNYTSEAEAETPSLQFILPLIITMITSSIITVIIITWWRFSTALINRDCSLARTNNRTSKKVALVYLFFFVNLSLLLSALSLSSLSLIIALINMVIFEVSFVLIVSIFYPKTNTINKIFKKVKLYSPQVRTDFSVKAQNENNKEVEDFVKGLNKLIE